ncbi:serine beta-lactamase-like protein LACTB, mitochondrial [Tubulanus polymorphus]|uniref:serine beta-lactamase-like protein LACTB, mitochondrial n=1 Tax=Tubulanus polymorphus TaxID=672921 RepID=UPI003DA35841
MVEKFRVEPEVDGFDKSMRGIRRWFAGGGIITCVRLATWCLIAGLGVTIASDLHHVRRKFEKDKEDDTGDVTDGLRSSSDDERGPSSPKTECWSRKRSSFQNMDQRMNVGSNEYFDHAISDCQQLIAKFQTEYGIPGLSVAVSVDGNKVWAEGIGFADVENRVPCTADTVMRIASISKPITMSILAKLMEAGKIDIDKPVQQYVTSWPQKTFQGKNVDITIRQLVSHRSGVRHYEKDPEKVKDEFEKIDRQIRPKKQRENPTIDALQKQKDEFAQSEMKNQRYFDSLEKSVDLFRNDPLIFEPGTRFLYSTPAWTLVSAAIEETSGIKITKLFELLFKQLGMNETYLDENSPIINNRSRYYDRAKNGVLKNSAYVDNSYKWAAGGLLSTAGDLVQFGNVMMYSYQNRHDSKTSSESRDEKSKIKFPSKDSGYNEQSHDLSFLYAQSSDRAGFLHASTMDQLWAPVDGTASYWDKDTYFGLGWVIVPYIRKFGNGKFHRFCTFHTGAAMGASSLLLCLPEADLDNPAVGSTSGTATYPKGVVVAILANMSHIGMSKIAHEIAKNFDEAKSIRNQSI